MFPLHDISRTVITPFITIALITANLLVFFLWQPHGTGGDAAAFLYEHAAVACEVVQGEPLTVNELRSGRCLVGEASAQPFPDKDILLSVVVSMFLHANLLHVGGNMWFLWIFGNNVEEAFGHILYAIVYLASGLAATFLFVLLNPEGVTPLIGASGAVAGVLGAYLVLFPGHLIVSLVVYYLLPVPAVIFLGLWFLGQFAMADPSVAWEAHVAGFLFGGLVALLFRGALLGHVRRLHSRAPVEG